MLKLLVPDGTSGVAIDTSTNEGKIMLARRLQLAQQSLSLREKQVHKAADALLQTRTDKGLLARQLGDLIVRMHNDNLRVLSDDQLVPAENQDPRLIMMRLPGVKVGKQHMICGTIL